MQALVTKFIGPTDHHGTYIKATCGAGTLTVSWDYELNVEENHHAAAMQLAAKLNWVGPNYGNLTSGTVANGDYCHVFSRGERLAELVMDWVKTPGNHGGNPYRHAFVKMAERILGLD